MVQRRTFKQSVPLPKGTLFSTEVISDNGYNPGRPNISQGTLEEDITIQATPATPYTCIINATNYEHQDILLNIWNSSETQITRTYTNPGIISLAYGTKYSINLRSKEGYIKSELINIIDGQIYTLTRNIIISAEYEAESIQCEIVVPPTQHQTITIQTDIDLNIESDTEDEERLVAPYWTKYIPTIEADPGYNPGILNSIGEAFICKDNPNFRSYSEDPDDEYGYVTVEATSATPNKHRVTIYKYEHQKIRIKYIFNDEENIITVDLPPVQSTSSYNIYEIFDSAEYYVTIVPEDGYQSLYPIIRYIENGETYTIDVTDSNQKFVLDRNIDLIAESEASISYHSISLMQSQDQTMYLSSGEYEDITGSINLTHNSEFIIRVEVKDPVHYDAGEVIATNDELTIIDTNTYKGIITTDNIIYITPAIIK